MTSLHCLVFLLQAEHVSKAEQALLHGCVGGGGGGGGGGHQTTCLVAKQAVEFPQVVASLIIILLYAN